MLTSALSVGFVRASEQRMNKDQLLRFARAFELCPGLLPRVEILQLFQCALNSAVPTGKQVCSKLYSR